jgi:pimeloyl-ACP methyl ester carboxylesterase
LRPGRSGGAPPAPRDPVEVVTELHDLLATADVPGPYVLVGHSLGGTFDVLYARTFPHEVAGLVTVDSPLPPSRDALGAELFEQARLMSSDPSLLPGYDPEAYDLGTLFDEIAAAGPLPDIPVIVVRRGGPAMSDDPLPDGLPFTAAEVEALNTVQWDSQVQWAASVPNAEVITVPATGHYVQSQRSDAVVDAIRSVASRSGRRSTTAPVTTPNGSADTQADFTGLVDIGGGRKMYLECHGQGSPTVVLLTGYGDTARIWSIDAPGLLQPHVLPAVAGFTRACAYDRPGTYGINHDRSHSDPVPQPRAPDDAVADLHALLQAAPVPGPYVLAGHSLGGAYVRLYAATYPDEVVGMVLIDIINGYLRLALTPQQWAVGAAGTGVPPPGLDYPEAERADVDVVLDAVERAVAAQPLHELPLVVLSRGSEDDVPAELAADLPPGFVDAHAAAPQEGQARLAALVPDARHVIATDSGHYIQLEQPALVIEAIRQVVEGVHHPNTWSDLVACCGP